MVILHIYLKFPEGMRCFDIPRLHLVPLLCSHLAQEDVGQRTGVQLCHKKSFTYRGPPPNRGRFQIGEIFWFALSIHPSIHPSVYLSIYLSIYVSIYLSLHIYIYIYTYEIWWNYLFGGTTSTLFVIDRSLILINCKLCIFDVYIYIYDIYTYTL